MHHRLYSNNGNTSPEFPEYDDVNNNDKDDNKTDSNEKKWYNNDNGIGHDNDKRAGSPMFAFCVIS